MLFQMEKKSLNRFRKFQKDKFWFKSRRDFFSYSWRWKASAIMIIYRCHRSSRFHFIHSCAFWKWFSFRQLAKFPSITTRVSSQNGEILWALIQLIVYSIMVQAEVGKKKNDLSLDDEKIILIRDWYDTNGVTSCYTFIAMTCHFVRKWPLMRVTSGRVRQISTCVITDLWFS